MKYLKNNLMKTISVNLLVLGTLTILTAVLPNNAFGQRDLSIITKGANVSLMNMSEECRAYRFTLTTGDVEEAGADGSVYVTINGENGSTDKILISGGLSLRRDGHNPTSSCLDMNTKTPSTFVTWGAENYIAETDAENWIGKHPIKNPFTRNNALPLMIYTYNVGNIKSITIHHDNWYPNWFLKRLEFSSDGVEISKEVNRWFRADTLNQTFPVQTNANLADYQISIYTGDVYQGGTNSNVYLLLNGYGGQVYTQLELAKMIPGNPFERNQTDYLGLYDRAPFPYINSITVSVPVGSRWFLGTINIDGPGLGGTQSYHYNNWVVGGTPVTLYNNSSSQFFKITYRNEGFYNAQMMVSYMKNNKDGILTPYLVGTPDMPIGQNSVLEVPYDAQSLKVFLIGVGTVKNDVYVSDIVGRPSGDPCFKSWGSTLSPQGGTCDGEPVAVVKPYTPPTFEPVKPLTAAENEQGCFDFGTKYLPVEYKKLDEVNLRKLCKGTPNPLNTLACFYNRYWKIGQDNAIVQCQGDIPLEKEGQLQAPSAPTNLNIIGGNASNTNIAQNEQDCFNQVQNKVAYDTAGNKTWNENNIKSLCRGTTNPPATISCFSQKMPQMGWAKASQECAATNISSQTQRVNQMPVPSQNQLTSTGISLEGNWVMYDDKGVKFDKTAKISQSGANISINNGYGTNSTAVLNGNSLKTSDGLSGTISSDGTKINWTINYVWVKQTSTSATTPNNPQVSPNSLPAKSLTKARDVDAKNGVVWAIGINSVPGGYGIYKFDGSSWTQIEGGATRIAVDNSGNPWIINADGTIFRRTGDAWTVIAGPNGATALDIAISNSGEVWIASDNGMVSRWTGSGWTNLIAISARKVIFIPNPDTFQIVDENGKRFVRESGTSWIATTDASGMADKYIEFAVDGETKWGIDSSFNIQRLSGGQSQGNYVVNEKQVQPVSQITNTPAPTKRSITFRNEAGFVAKMMIQYFEAGPNGMSLPKFLFTENLPVGQSKTLEIPNSAPNTQVIVSLIGSGTTKDNFFSTNLDAAFNGNRCFKAWGTLFSPQGGACQ